MHPSKLQSRSKAAPGFTLPAILVVVSALLILAVGVLLVVSIERNTSRAFSDRERAKLAARAGLEDVKGILAKEAANDDFLILQGVEAKAPAATKDPAPYLYLARGSGGGDQLKYRYVPLFSTESIPTSPDAGSPFAAPDASDLIGASPEELGTLPWYDPAKISWINITNSKNQVVSRYAYWVEDLQGRVDASSAGNTKNGGAHKRYGWNDGDVTRFKNGDTTALFPAPGLNAEKSNIGANGRDSEPPLDQIALFALDPEVADKDTSDLDKNIIEGRKALVSPDSVLAVAGSLPPLTRGTDGHFIEEKNRALDESLAASVQPYDELALIPFSYGIDPSVTGKPKLNLNTLLAKPPATAVDEMAEWIQKGLPTFVNRKGAFPDNYLKTLAANTIDYVDTDHEATTSGDIMGPNTFRGLDAYPMMSEVILHFKYRGLITYKGRKLMNWQMLVFVELWNHTNFKASGLARVSYDNNLQLPAIGAEIARTFDDEDLLTDASQVQPTLAKIGDEFWSAEFNVDLEPNQYKFYNPILLNYTVDLGPSTTQVQNQFNIDELTYGDSGISLMWNGKEVDRSHKLLRGNVDANYSKTDFKTDTQKQNGYANIPGHSYGLPGSPAGFKNNMGDSRQSLYLRSDDFPLSDNSYPGNVSPNQRNIRNVSVYLNGTGQSNIYGRVLPSEWPDGGHDVPVRLSALSPPGGYSTPDDYIPSDTARFPDYKVAKEGDTPTVLSNAGRFYSATELGRIFDPIMFVPTYNNNDSVLGGTMPSGRSFWPSVEVSNTTNNPQNIYYGGGNTLRIGRPEHPKFDQLTGEPPAEMPGTHAARLLDLFHAGKSRSTSQEEREGALVRIEGHVNLNTASEDALRALAAGVLKADPRIAKTTSLTHSTSTAALPVTELEVSALTDSKQADLLAQAIIRGRPYSSPSEIATSRDVDGNVALGNPLLYPEFKVPGKINRSTLQWSDAAAEETFARIYNSSTVRSRNFRVWVVGQAVAPTVATNTTPEVLSEVRRVFTIFADPGERASDGSIDSTKFKTSIFHENDF